MIRYLNVSYSNQEYYHHNKVLELAENICGVICYSDKKADMNKSLLQHFMAENRIHLSQDCKGETQKIKNNKVFILLRVNIVYFLGMRMNSPI